MADTDRTHSDNCRDCWALYVDLRWELARDSVDVAELKAFLGGRFVDGIDASWALVDDWESSPRESVAEVEDFYRSTDWYVYNLVVWKASGQRPAYVANANEVISIHELKSVLDFGAGVGNDALEFAEAGLRVIACDFNNVAADFLKWRATRRGLNIDFVDADILRNAPAAQRTDLVWAMDVFEHVADPATWLTRLLQHPDVVMYSSEHTGDSGGRHPFHIQHNSKLLPETLAAAGFSFDSLCSGTSGLRTYARDEVHLT
ncbi:MAG: class I SAM-dependent methyltransferase [bacterium]|nr:class I SAM-dependent methyltransferase [bacterium]